MLVVATPIKTSNEVLLELAQRRPRGVVFDLGSLKTPLRSGLMALQSAGVCVTSVFTRHVAEVEEAVPRVARVVPLAAQTCEQRSTFFS